MTDWEEQYPGNDPLSFSEIYTTLVGSGNDEEVDAQSMAWYRVWELSSTLAANLREHRTGLAEAWRGSAAGLVFVEQVDKVVGMFDKVGESAQSYYRGMQVLRFALQGAQEELNELKDGEPVRYAQSRFDETTDGWTGRYAHYKRGGNPNDPYFRAELRDGTVEPANLPMALPNGTTMSPYGGQESQLLDANYDRESKAWIRNIMSQASDRMRALEDVVDGKVRPKLVDLPNYDGPKPPGEYPPLPIPEFSAPVVPAMPDLAGLTAPEVPDLPTDLVQAPLAPDFPPGPHLQGAAVPLAPAPPSAPAFPNLPGAPGLPGAPLAPGAPIPPAMPSVPGGSLRPPARPGLPGTPGFPPGLGRRPGGVGGRPGIRPPTAPSSPPVLGGTKPPAMPGTPGGRGATRPTPPGLPPGMPRGRQGGRPGAPPRPGTPTTPGGTIPPGAMPRGTPPVLGGNKPPTRPGKGATTPPKGGPGNLPPAGPRPNNPRRTPARPGTPGAGAKPPTEAFPRPPANATPPVLTNRTPPIDTSSGPALGRTPKPPTPPGTRPGTTPPTLGGQRPASGTGGAPTPPRGQQRRRTDRAPKFSRNQLLSNEWWLIDKPNDTALQPPPPPEPVSPPAAALNTETNQVPELPKLPDWEGGIPNLPQLPTKRRRPAR